MCALVTGVQTCALPICQVCAGSRQGAAASAESSRVGRAGDQSRRMPMITVHLRYEIDPDKIEEFNHYRSAERRVGKECVRTCCYRWSPYPLIHQYVNTST